MQYFTPEPEEAAGATVPAMTVLVDDARWEWRGTRWAHLVSDESYGQLHLFAQQLGKRRLGFQGDHYDIDKIDRDRAVALGAEVVDSRILVRRLRVAGLRRRDHKPKWERVAEAVPGRPLEFESVVESFGDPGDRLHDSVASLGDLEVVSNSAVFADDHHLVALLDIGPGVEVDLPELPHVAEIWTGRARADGDRSVELFVTR